MNVLYNVSDIGKLVKLKGMVTRASDVKPHMTVCTYTCDVCGADIFQEITGPTYKPLFTCISKRCTESTKRYVRYILYCYKYSSSIMIIFLCWQLFR